VVAPAMLHDIVAFLKLWQQQQQEAHEHDDLSFSNWLCAPGTFNNLTLDQLRTWGEGNALLKSDIRYREGNALL
jgi:hypothetical protein